MNEIWIYILAAFVIGFLCGAGFVIYITADHQIEPMNLPDNWRPTCSRPGKKNLKKKGMRKSRCL